REQVEDSRQIKPTLIGAYIGDRNGVIIKDKFCLSRTTQLTLRWSRYDVWLKRKAKIQENSSESNLCDGGIHETTMANQATDDSIPRWTKTVGPSLPTGAWMESKQSAMPSLSRRAKDSGGSK
ncbi:MAG: hypothetical protein KJ069_27295, partial [Anaerolineae bacterium]|nr:hypothetical protein [Anaerolineae bacterium]